MKTRKRQTGGLRPDSQGRYKTDLGFYRNEAGDIKPKRFWLGTDRSKAEASYHRLHALWSDLAKAGNTVWTDETLGYADAIRTGQAPQFVPSKPDPIDRHFAPQLNAWGFSSTETGETARQFAQAKVEHPSLIDMVPPADIETSTQANREFIAHRMEQLRKELDQLGAMAAAGNPSLDQITGVTVQQALERFSAAVAADKSNLDPDGILTQWGKNKHDMSKSLQYYFKEFLALDVGELGKDQCDGMIKLIAARPISQWDKPLAKSSARHLIWLTRQFLQWLDGSNIRWELPGKFRLNTRVQYRKPDIKELAQQIDEPQTIPVETLKTLISHATEREKLYIGLSLNCAYGADQLGRLQAEWIDWSTGQIKGARLKRATASRHYLWACNLERLKEHLDGRTKGTIFVNEDNEPIYHKSKKGNTVDGISRAWEKNLYPRVRKALDDQNYPWFSYGKLRKTSATLTLEKADPAIASMLLAHKTISDDELLAAYARLPWDKLYGTQRQLEAELVDLLGL